MARPAINYKETFECPHCGKKQVVYVPNATVWHSCKVGKRQKVVTLESTGSKKVEKNAYKQGTLNL